MKREKKLQLYDEFSNFVAVIAISFYNTWVFAEHSYLDSFDFIQEALMNFWIKITTIKDTKRFKQAAYIRTITENFLKNFIRKEHTKKRFYIKETSQMSNFLSEDKAFDDFDIENCDKLSPSEKKACIMLKEGTDLKDVAKTLQWTTNSQERHLGNIRYLIWENNIIYV